MDKETEVLGVKEGANGNEGEVAESRPMPPYRIICNSEHFIVLNPVQRKRPKETVRVDEGHEETAGLSKRFQTIIKSAREKGAILYGIIDNNKTGDLQHDHRLNRPFVPDGN